MYATNELPSENYQHPQPWLPDELMTIGRLKLVYTKLSGDYLIHFPGGHSEYLTALQRRGVPVVTPRFWRDTPRVR